MIMREILTLLQKYPHSWGQGPRTGARWQQPPLWRRVLPLLEQEGKVKVKFK